jgi:hypothetical protein
MNKPMTKFQTYSALLLALVALPLLGAEKAAQFPLMAWDYVDDKPTLEAMRDCGITCIAFVRPKLLDACQKYGLKAIVFDESVVGTNWSQPWNGDQACANLRALVKKTVKHPAVMGYHLKDEPPAKDFPELAKAVARVKELAPGKWPYINLFPGKGDSYDQYLEDFVNTCNPTVLSYDRYSLFVENEIDQKFWSCLAQVRAAAVKHQLPFWNIVLTSPHWGYRELTEADVRLQTWGSLVYGVRGLAYYKFCSKELAILDAPDLGNFRNGPLDQFGEKTLTWQWLRTVNRQIQNIAPVYLKLRTDDVYHFGTVPDRNHGPTATNLVKALPKGDFVVGDFTHEDGSRYVLIVNKSLKASIPCQPTFATQPAGVNYVSPRTGKTQPIHPKFYYLAPGQGVLLQLKQ